MIANETTFHKRPNDTEINNYRSLYGIYVELLLKIKKNCNVFYFLKVNLLFVLSGAYKFWYRNINCI